MIYINLLPWREKIRKRKTKIFISQLIISLLASTALCIFFYANIKNETLDKENNIKKYKNISNLSANYERKALPLYLEKNKTAEKEEDTSGLHHYSFKEILIKGVIDRKDKKWLIASDPLNQIYCIKIGEFLGKEKVMVSNITFNKISFTASSHDGIFLKYISEKSDTYQVVNHECTFSISL